jgi:hypothetical protein
MCDLVAAATSGRPFTTFDTVDTETPAADAIVARVARSVLLATSSSWYCVSLVLAHGPSASGRPPG